MSAPSYKRDAIYVEEALCLLIIFHHQMSEQHNAEYHINIGPGPPLLSKFHVKSHVS